MHCLVGGYMIIKHHGLRCCRVVGCTGWVHAWCSLCCSTVQYITLQVIILHMQAQLASADGLTCYRLVLYGAAAAAAAAACCLQVCVLT